MKPPPFHYEAPESIEEVLSLLAQHGDEAKLLAGGQSLMPLLNFRLARPKVLIDLNWVRELDYMREDAGQIVIGAMTRQREVEMSDWLRGEMSALPEIIRHVGHVTIRNRGTVGGSLAHADPAAELPMLSATFSAEFTLVGSKSLRIVPASEFFIGPLSSALDPTEILKEVRIPSLVKGAGVAVEELAQRSGDFAIVAALAAVHCDDDGRCDHAWLGVSGAHFTPMKALEAEQVMVGEQLTDELIADVSNLVASQVDPQNDVHADADYRRDMIRVYVGRAIAKAVKRQRQVDSGR